MPKRIAMLLALMMTMSAAVLAQKTNSGDIFVGYSFNRASTGWSNKGNLNGWAASAEGKVAPWLGFVADVSAQYGTLQMSSEHLTLTPGLVNSPTRVVSYLVGTRVSISKGKFQPFAQALVGSAHLHASAPEYDYGETKLADAFAGGLDYNWRPQISWREQIDLLQTRFHGGLQNDARFSTGLVWKF